jgi:SAM-dependent methyltransferase
VTFLDALRRCATHTLGRTEADIQSDVKSLLLAGEFLEDADVALEAPVQSGRIDVEYGALVIECKRRVDPAHKSELAKAEVQLQGYLASRQATTGGLYAGILTDGGRWRHYRLDAGGEVRFVSEVLVDKGVVNDRDFRDWLGSALPTEPKVAPQASTIEARLGAGSPAHDITVSRLAELLEYGHEAPEVVLKKELWSKLLRTAFGTQFEGTDDLFIEHTYLVTLAVLIARAAFGLPAAEVPGRMLSGEEFAENGITGVGEAGFFDWMLGVDGGEELVSDVARRASAFDWTKTDHDVLKALYHSVISPEIRHRLGEYYTPDWLADRMVRQLVTDPLTERVLDPACGSGTFLFAAITLFLEEAAGAGVPVGDAVTAVGGHVAGIDLHPVAVSLAQVTYLLAVGIDRLAERSGTFSVPVYLGDSMRWEESATGATESLFSSAGDVVVATADGEELFPTELRFPANVVARTDFDTLVSHMAQLATTREPYGPRPSVRNTLDRYASTPAERRTLEATFSLLCDLHDKGRDHIWGFFVRNQAKPAWFAQEPNRVDVVVGNPPWLSYRYMPKKMQERFRSRSEARNLWAGGRVATHQDLSAFFVVRSVELYLKQLGRFGFVVPYAVLSRQSYEGFRTGRWSGPKEKFSLGASFAQPWDLLDISPDPFPVPSAVAFGRRTDGEHTGALPSVAEHLRGRATGSGPWASVADGIEIAQRTVTAMGADGEHGSSYGDRFRNGATLYPRMLVLVDKGAPNPLATARQRSVRSHRSPQEKLPWKNLPDLTGNVEAHFIHSVLLGESIVPFQVMTPLEGVIPWSKSTGLMDSASKQLGQSSGLAQWWRKAEQLWEEYRGSKNTLSLLGQLDYLNKLSDQFPIAPVRVVYTKSGNTLAAAVVMDPTAVVENSLYWAAVPSVSEARYLAAVLNAPVFTTIVEPYQSRGAFGPRHFDKYVWLPPTPVFDGAKPSHRHLAELAERAEEIAAGVECEGGFQAARRRVRQALKDAGIADELDAAVGALLGWNV